LGDREAHLKEAIHRLEHKGVEILRCSSIFETQPAYFADQPKFLNMVVEAQVEFSPWELLRRTQRVEREMGRAATVDKGPRNIDIDILLFQGISIQSPRLTIPHKLMHEREFVLMPLSELRPDFFYR
jgi:2-amino-4-hydroxy-6-hydroxymethyldihydropteridine diphosphokinase